MPDTASVSLEVAPSDKLQQLVDQITAMTGGDEGGGGGGGGRQNMAGRVSKMGKAGSKMVQTGLKKAGVSFSLASMLKQSQIFTGFLGSLFQILGGFLDVLLAPLIPILMPLLVFLGRMIPIIGKLAQIILGPVVFIIELIMKVVYWLLDGIMHVFDKYFDNIIETFTDIVDRFKTAWGYIKEGKIWEATKEMLGGLWDIYMAPVAIIWDTIVGTGADIWEWLTGFKLVQDMRDWWNALFAESIKPWIASIWNPIVDGMQFIMDKLVEGINAISPFKDISKVDLSSLKMDVPTVLEKVLEELKDQKTKPDIGLRPPDYRETLDALYKPDIGLRPPDYGPPEKPANVSLHLSGLEPQQKVEALQDDKKDIALHIGSIAHDRPSL